MHKNIARIDDLHDYVLSVSLRPPACLDELTGATQQTEHPQMASAPIQCQLLAFLAKSIGATRVIEVGVFTGVGTLWLADAVGPGGTVVGCDISEDFTSIGRPFWEEAGVADRIDLRLAPAADTLAGLLESPGPDSFDFCYIDADKQAYDKYYELVLPLIRPGGIIAFDNMLLHGRVADPGLSDEPVPSIRALNEKLHADGRVDVSFLPLCDGLYLARKL